MDSRENARTTPAIYGVVRWRITDLGLWLWEESQVLVPPQTLSGGLRGMGLRKLSARPKHHAQAEGAIAAFKKGPQACWQASCRIRVSSPRPSRSGSPMVELRSTWRGFPMERSTAATRRLARRSARR